jgi:hypothetical protein
MTMIAWRDCSGVDNSLIVGGRHTRITVILHRRVDKPIRGCGQKDRKTFARARSKQHMTVDGVLISYHINGREISFETLDVLNECLLRSRQMDGGICTLLDDWNKHCCATVFDGERGGINGVEVGNIIRQINDGSSGLDKREANNSVNRHVGYRGNDNTRRGSVLHEVWQVELKPHRQLGGDRFPSALDNT